MICVLCGFEKLEGCGERGTLTLNKSGFTLKHIVCPNLKQEESERPFFPFKDGKPIDEVVGREIENIPNSTSPTDGDKQHLEE